MTDANQHLKPILTAPEVAKKFGVNARTIGRWSDAGMIPCFRTLGGHRRYDAREIERLVEIQSQAVK